MKKVSEYSRDTTFVIQGPITPLINLSIEEIRKSFLDAPIIVSTCSDIDIEIIGADKIIKSDDPGFLYRSHRRRKKLNNINRQIINTLAGLKNVKTPYCFKLRSDFLIKGNGFLNYIDQFQKFDPNYLIFKKKILSCCYFARNPYNAKVPFHISDLCFWGLTTDLVNFFDVPLMTQRDAVRRAKKSNHYVAEQYLFINCLRKNKKNVACDFHNDANPANCKETERYFASNFIFLDFNQFNVQPTKKHFLTKVNPNSFKTCYTHIEWQHLYKKYVDSTLVVPGIDNERIKIEKSYKVYRKSRTLANIVSVFFFNRSQRRKIRNAILEWYPSD